MIALRTLEYLSAQKKKDAIALLKAGRNVGAVYLMGYSIEFMLKRKICTTLGFHKGFPDNGADFQTYAAQRSKFNTLSTSLQLTQIRQIRHHNLNELLRFTGIQMHISKSYIRDWININSWNPEDRYKLKKCSSEKAMQFITSCNIILKQIV